MNKTDSEWEKELDPERFKVMRQGGTERPFSGALYNNHERGMYVCGACGQELFSSAAKFDSGTGWPSFVDPVNREHIELVPDESHGMNRTEVRCKQCGSHLGHLFDDGPKDRGGKRFCINSCALDFKKSADEEPGL